MHFTTLAPQPDDPILSLMAAFATDSRPAKIDLGIGVYRDEHGATPIMASVKVAEDWLLAGQASKGYLGVEGDPVFTEALRSLIFGHASATMPVTGVQAVGGTGALRLAADLLALEQPLRTVWLGLPSWPNHAAVFRAARLGVATFRHVDPATGTLDLAAVEEALMAAAPGDVMVLHGCCHNPTGIDPTPVQWGKIGALMALRGVLPLVDLAYHGLGQGLAQDRAGLAALLHQVPAALIAYSCSKNFALYRERVGALFVAGTQAGVERAHSNMIALARANYSMPPDHGAAVVRTILTDPELAAQWEQELGQMVDRVKSLRRRLAAAGQAGPVDLSVLTGQHGFFAMLALSPRDVIRLREEHGVYIAPNGRTNIAGLRDDQVDAFVAGLRAMQ